MSPLRTRTPSFNVGSKVTELTGDIPIDNSATKPNSSVSRITQPRVSSDCQPIDEGSNAYLLFAESQGHLATGHLLSGDDSHFLHYNARKADANENYP